MDAPIINNYNIQALYNYHMPDTLAFIPKIYFTKYTTYNFTTYNFSMDDFCNNLVSKISNNVLCSYQPQITETTQIINQTKKDNYKKDIVYSPTTKQNNISYDAEKLKSKWENSKYASRAKHLPSEFFQKVVDISNIINCNPDDLIAVMNAESGLKASAKNSSSGATGLIQFIEKTANSLGTSCDELSKMTETKQLDYVKNYFLKWKAINKLGNTYLDLATLYSLVLSPANANKEILYTENSAGYNGNRPLDLDGKNGISKSEIKARVMQFIA